MKKYCEKVDNSVPLANGERDTIIKWIYSTHIVEYYATAITKIALYKLEDKIQDIYQYICELPEETLDDLYAQGEIAIKSYVTGMVHQQLISKNSKLYRKYDRVKHTELLMDDLFWENYVEV